MHPMKQSWPGKIYSKGPSSSLLIGAHILMHRNSWARFPEGWPEGGVLQVLQPSAGSSRRTLLLRSGTERPGRWQHAGCRQALYRSDSCLCHCVGGWLSNFLSVGVLASRWCFVRCVLCALWALLCVALVLGRALRVVRLCRCVAPRLLLFVVSRCPWMKSSQKPGVQ